MVRVHILFLSTQPSICLSMAIHPSAVPIYPYVCLCLSMAIHPSAVPIHPYVCMPIHPYVCPPMAIHPSAVPIHQYVSVCLFQWWIQDFPDEGAPIPSLGGRQHTILPNFPQNCMKLKEFGLLGRASLVPPLRSACGSVCRFFSLL